jgi:HlyD family secretion protein
MKKYFKLFLAALVALVFIGMFVFLWQKSQPKADVYEVFTPKVMDLRKTTVVTGKIEPRNEVNVKPQISGIIAEIMKEAGDHVQAGEVIARVKVIPDMQQLSSAQSRVRLATVNAQQAKVDLEREQVLFDKGLVSADEYDKIRQAYNQSREELTAANDQLQVVRDGVSRTNASASSTLVRSTISGLILDIPVKVGNSVILSNTFNDGTTIATVANMGDLIFRGNIDETEVGSLVTGMPMQITIGAMQNLQFEATLEYIAPKAVESNGANQFELKAAVRQRLVDAGEKGMKQLGKNRAQAAQLRSGYSANASIVLAEVKQALAIPESAIEFADGKTFVYVVKGTDKHPEYERRAVTTGMSDGLNIQIISGLKKDEQVRGPKVIAEEQQ